MLYHVNSGNLDVNISESSPKLAAEEAIKKALDCDAILGIFLSVRHVISKETYYMLTTTVAKDCGCSCSYVRGKNGNSESQETDEYEVVELVRPELYPQWKAGVVAIRFKKE